MNFSWLSITTLAVCVLIPLLPQVASSASIQSRTDKGVLEIAVSGDIDLQDGEKFAIAAGGAQHGIVVFDSDGGSLLAALRIGAIINEHGFATAVMDGSTCASACAIAWLGGSARFLGRHSLLGFHAAYDQKTGTEAGEGNAILGAYLAHLGLSFRAIASVTAAGPQEMNWLDADEANELGIAASSIPETNKFTLPKSAIKPSEFVGGNPSLEKRATQFLRTYFARGSDSAERALAFDDTAYASSVNYYGSIRSKAEVIADKRSYVNRWPERLYLLQGSTISTVCDHVRAVCNLEGRLDFECRSHTRAAHSAGVSKFSLTISFADSRIKIISEDGRVVRRF